MRDLAAEYIAGAPDLQSFYAGPPKALLERAPESVTWDPEFASALRAHTERMAGSGANVRVPAQGIAIVTGQQPAIFTGPLYTVYKAITAITLAHRLEARSGTPCMPVFWVGSDDHDFDEARSAHVLTKNHEPLTLTYEPQAPVEGLPMFAVPVEDSLHGLIDRAAAETPGSEFRHEIAEMLHDRLTRSKSVAAWAEWVLGYLFRDTPLIQFASSPVSRRLAIPVFEREIAEPLRSTALLNEAGARLQALGYPQQVVKAADECNFFLLVEQRRRKVLYQGEHFVLPEENRRYTPDELLAMLRETPEAFSPNVALRCVVQQQLFRAAAYVAGPGEIAYWAQLKPLFEHFGLPMPIVYPRARAVLTTLKLNKLRRKYGFGVKDLVEPRDAIVERALRHTVRNGALDAVRSRRQPVEAALRTLVEGLDGEATARAMAEGLEKRVSEELDRVERALVRSDRAQTEAVEKQVERLCNALAPWRKPQERVYTVFSFLFQQGPGMIPRLIDELDVESFQVNEVEL